MTDQPTAVAPEGRTDVARDRRRPARRRALLPSPRRRRPPGGVGRHRRRARPLRGSRDRDERRDQQRSRRSREPHLPRSARVPARDHAGDGAGDPGPGDRAAAVRTAVPSPRRRRPRRDRRSRGGRAGGRLVWISRDVSTAPSPAARGSPTLASRPSRTWRARQPSSRPGSRGSTVRGAGRRTSPSASSPWYSPSWGWRGCPSSCSASRSGPRRARQFSSHSARRTDGRPPRWWSRGSATPGSKCPR